MDNGKSSCFYPFIIMLSDVRLEQFEKVKDNRGVFNHMLWNPHCCGLQFVWDTSIL